MKIEDIKFKAKRLDNGEWVKGDLVHSTSYVGISYPSGEFSDVPIVHRVDPSTVCQFTGLKDCEAKRFGITTFCKAKEQKKSMRFRGVKKKEVSLLNYQ